MLSDEPSNKARRADKRHPGSKLDRVLQSVEGIMGMGKDVCRRLSTVENHHKGLSKRLTELERRVKCCETTPKHATKSFFGSAKSKASHPDSSLKMEQNDEPKLTMVIGPQTN
eukprot:689898-Amphidinium_carterae.3